MSATLHPIPVSAPTLPLLARWLLGHRPGRDPADLADVLVLLPSQRACEQLRHDLLDAAPTPSLLLPWLTTPGRLASELADLQGLVAEDLPPADLRALLLAPSLARQPWLEHRPEAATGLAAELITLFDDVRLARLDDLILAGTGDIDAVLRHAEPGSEAVVLGDLARIREAWGLYRALLPADQVDASRAALDAAARQWPGPLPRLVVAAHLGRLDAVTRDLLHALADQQVPVQWLSPAADAPGARLLLATYRDAMSPTHPLAAAARLAEQVTGEPPPPPMFEGADLATRMHHLAAARATLDPDGPLALWSCRDPEHEARVVAAAVCEALSLDGQAPDIIVASPDRDLAARITAHLRDAGVDVDDTRGRSLLNLPAGRLLRDLLRTAVGGWPFGSVFEVLGHPYARLADAGQRPGHGVRTQLLEAVVRRARSARSGRSALHDLARDDAAAGLVVPLVERLSAALEPLMALTTGEHPWSAMLTAVRHAWHAVAPDRPLDGEPDPRGDHDDLGAVHQLLADLDQAAPLLPPTTLADQAAALGELLRSAEVRPRRQRHLPVRVMGLVEARLEHAALLVLAGLSQDTFPGRLPRPLFLPDRVRRGLGLPHWREKAGRDGELMLRLLAAAPRLVITWPRERDGRPSLPSPLVQRLIMASPAPPREVREQVAYRRSLPDLDAMAEAERRHRAEPEPVPAPDVPAPRRLSHSTLQLHRECPYRFLLGAKLSMRRLEPLEAEFSAVDHGNQAHAVMQAWLTPGGAGQAALTMGDGPGALAALEAAAAEVRRDRGQALPGSEVALRALLSLAPDLVDLELSRWPLWRPAALEASFTITLGQVDAWLRANGVQPPPLPPEHADFPLQGAIDRIDVAADGQRSAAVVDYKTGDAPPASRVKDGRVLQLHLYAVAVEAGSVQKLAPAAAGWTVREGAYQVLRRRDFGRRTSLEPGEQLTAGVLAIQRQALAILDPDQPFALVPDWQDAEATGQLPCRYCEFRGVCRLEERDTTPALAARLDALITAAPRSLS